LCEYHDTMFKVSSRCGDLGTSFTPYALAPLRRSNFSSYMFIHLTNEDLSEIVFSSVVIFVKNNGARLLWRHVMWKWPLVRAFKHSQSRSEWTRVSRTDSRY